MQLIFVDKRWSLVNLKQNFTVIAWMLRMSFDPITTFLLDDRFKKVITRAKAGCFGEIEKSSLPSGRSNSSPPPIKVNDPNSMISFVQVSPNFIKFKT